MIGVLFSLSFLASHFVLAGLPLVAIAAVVAFMIFGGPLAAMVLNRRVLGGIAILIVVCLVGLMGYALVDHLKAEGARELAEANQRAAAQRKGDIAASDQEQSDLVKEGQDRAAASRQQLERARAERKSHVSSAADAACPVPRGFVHDHDRDVPGAAGRAEVPIAEADINKPVPGLVLSRIGKCVGSNYTECAKIDADARAANEVRYQACLAWDKRWGTKSNCVR